MEKIIIRKNVFSELKVYPLPRYEKGTAHDEMQHILNRAIEAATPEENWKRSKVKSAVRNYITHIASYVGFAFISHTTIEKKLNCSRTPIDHAVSAFRASGLVDIFYLENDEHNGVETLVYVFKSHPNYNNIMAFLIAKNVVKNVAENVEEIVETPTAPTVEESKNVPNKDLLNKNLLKTSFKDKTPEIDWQAQLDYELSYVDKNFRNLAYAFFKDFSHIRKLWGAARKAKDKLFIKEDRFKELSHVVVDALRALRKPLKANKIKDLGKYFYTVVLEKLGDAEEEAYMLEIERENKKKAISVFQKPEWMEADPIFNV